MDITVSVPDQYLADHEPAELADRIMLYAELLMFDSGEISAGAACEFAGVDRFTFAAECARRSIPLARYTAEEIRAESFGLDRIP